MSKGALPKNPFLALWATTIGKKMVMAVTGAIFVLFVIGHLLGNLKIFAGPEEINTYSRFLREFGQPELGYGHFLWIVRMILLAAVILHITAAFQLSRMNRAARPAGYSQKKNVETTISARLMGWGGVVILIFIVFHLLHFTAGKVGFRPGQFKELAVYQNVVAGFSVWPVAVFYVVAMAALSLHLDHGTWSMLQTLGWINRKNTKALRTLSRVFAIVMFLGFTSIPIAVMAGWLR